MSNRNFNKQVTQSRKPLLAGGPAGTGKGAAPFKGPREDPRKRSGGPKKGRPSLLDKIKKARPAPNPKRPAPDPKGTGKGVRPKPTPRKPSPEIIDIFKKRKQERDQKRMKNSKPESPERKKRQADYMKKHGKNEPRRKTLSVKNTYKKEVEGLK
jgi:hypothetical protein